MDPYYTSANLRAYVGQHCLSVTGLPDTVIEANLKSLFPNAIRAAKVPSHDQSETVVKWLVLFDSVQSTQYQLFEGRKRQIGNLSLGIQLCDVLCEIPEEWLKTQFHDYPPIGYPGMYPYPGQPGYPGQPNYPGHQGNQGQQSHSGQQGYPGQQGHPGQGGQWNTMFTNPYNTPPPPLPQQGRNPAGGQSPGNPDHQFPHNPYVFRPGHGQPGYFGPGYPGYHQGQVAGHQGFPGQGHPFPGPPYPGHQTAFQGNVLQDPSVKNEDKDQDDGSGDEAVWSPPGETTNQGNNQDKEKRELPRKSPPPTYDQSEKMHQEAGVPPSMPPQYTDVPPTVPYSAPYVVPMAHFSQATPQKHQQSAPTDQGPHIERKGPDVCTPNEKGLGPVGTTKQKDGPAARKDNVPADSLTCGSDAVSSQFKQTKDATGNDSNSEPLSVRVSDLQPGTTEDTLKKFFAKKRQSGGENVESVELDVHTMTAIVTFADPETVKRVLSKTPLTLNKKQIKVEVYTGKDDNKEDDDNDENSEPVSIKVSNLPPGTTEELLENFFENKKKSGGEDVESVDFDEDTMTAIVTFADCETVKRVLSKTPLIFNKKQIKVEVFKNKDDDEDDDNSDPVSIRVSNLPPTTTGESLENFFENKKKSGGEDVESVDFDEDTKTAIVTFADSETVKRVMSKTPLLFNKKQIKVEVFKRDDDNEDAEEEEEEDESDGCTIEVRGFKESTTEDTIEMYFENKKKSGGGEVSKIEKDEDEEVYYVTFENKEVVQSVLAKKGHKLDGAVLKVKLYEPPPPPKPVPKYENRLFIYGFNPEMSRDSLENFLEAKAGTDVVEVIYGEEEGTAMVTFEEPPDFEKLESVCKKKQLEKHWIHVDWVPISNCVIVTNFKDTTSEDAIEMYFDNKKRSGGGGVVKAEMNKEDGTCIVYFEDSNTCESVCERGPHKLEGQTLIVQIYHERLGVPSTDEDGVKFKVPESILLQNLDVRKMQFLYSSKSNKEAVDRQVSQTYGKITWPEKHNGPLKVECTLTKDVKDCKKLGKTWKKDITDAVNKFMNVLMVNIVPVLKEGWKDVMSELQTMNVEHPEGVAVVLEKSSHEIILVGHKKPVSDLQVQVEKILRKVSEEQDRKKQQITEELSLKHHQILFLSMQHFKEDLQKMYPDMKVELKLKEREIVFSGLSGNVTNAKLQLYEKLNAICSSSAGNFSKPRISFLTENQDVKKHISQKMKEAQILAVWDIQNKEELMTYAATDDEAVQAAHIMKVEIVESPVDVSPESVYLLHDDKFKQRCAEIKKDYPLFTSIITKKGILIVTVKDNLANIREMMEDFFTFNTVLSEEMKLTPNMMKFLNMRYKKEVENLAKGLETLQVKIELSREKIVIKGTREGLQQAKQAIDKILKGIVKRRHELKRPGIVKLIKSENGIAKLTKVEKSTRCVINLEEDEGVQGEGQDRDLNRSWSGQKGGQAKLGDGEVAKHCTQSGAQIVVFKGDLTSMDVDMLVNAANSELKHTGGLAKALVKKGGQSIQQECTDIVKHNGRLSEGDVAVTSAGSLRCKKIAHAVGPAWKGGNEQERENLEDCILKSMEETDNLRFQSIAIPALCTGIFGFPIPEATLVIVRSVKKYLRKNPSSGIMKVILCDVRVETVMGFSHAMRKEYGADKVTFIQQITEVEKGGGCRKERRYPGGGGADEAQQQTELIMGKVRVKIVKGQIAHQQADMIVNTASRDLNLRHGFVSSSLLKLGGDTLQQECKNQHSDGIEYGDIAVTSGGNLKCKHVCHGALPPWKNDPTAALEVLQTFLKNCLKEASKKKAKSIALPALGTGNLGYPKDDVAKEMFNAAAEASSHKSSIKEVKFVIFDKDVDTLKAFESELRSRASASAGSGSEDKKNKKGPRHGKLEKEEEEFVHVEDLPPSTDQVSVAMGPLTLNIYQGDLTMVDVDVIVNSTNAEIDLNKGAVAKTIKKLGGEGLEKQIQIHKETMKKDGVVVTTNGGPPSKLAAKNIIHVDATDSKTWKQRIVQILAKAEETGMKSIAMQALGTGVGGESVDSVAKSIYEAMQKYTKDHTPQHLTEVHIVIFQQSMVQSFIVAMQGCFQGTKPKGFFGKALDYVTGGNKDPKWQPKISKQPVSMSCIALVIFGDNDGDIDRAIRELERIIDEDFSMKEIKERIIAELSNNQIKTIQQLEGKYHVEVKIDKAGSSIKLYGTLENLMSAGDVVHSIIRDAEKNKQAKQQADLVQEMVQWCFLETGPDKTEMEEYPANVNLLIEQAFRNKEPVAKFKDNSGKEYTISFATMEEFPTLSPEDKVQVIRKEKLKDATFELPSTWEEMKDNENLTVITVKQGDKEYSDVIGKFHSSVGSSRPIVKLERIQNKMLFQQYLAKKKLMEAQNKQGTQNERELWHGTAPEAVDSINSYGFNRSYCGKNATAFGDGVYFAVPAQYSAQDQYSRKDAQGNKQMYFCRVLTGEFTVGKSGMRVPPVKQGGQSHLLYDSVANNMQNPIMFIIFNDTQAYPDYLITFK